jgi:ABC-type histidine transport system ATPase subunit
VLFLEKGVIAEDGPPAALFGPGGPERFARFLAGARR